MLGDIVKLKGEVIPYVIVGYKDHNAGDYGACCYNEDYQLIRIEDLNKLIDHFHPNPIPELELLRECRSYELRYTTEYPFEPVTDIAPFIIEKPIVYTVRQKRATTVTVYV